MSGPELQFQWSVPNAALTPVPHWQGLLVARTDPWRLDLIRRGGSRHWSIAGRSTVVKTAPAHSILLADSAEPSARFLRVSEQGDVIEQMAVAGVVAATPVGASLVGVRKVSPGPYELVCVDIEHAWDAPTRRVLGQAGRWDPGLAGSDGSVLLGFGQEMMCINVADGRVVWRSAMEPVQIDLASGKVWPVVSGRRLVANGAWGLIAFDVATGAMVWHYMHPCWKTVADGRVYCLSKDYAVLDAETGEVLVLSSVAKRIQATFGAKSAGKWRGGLNFARPTVWGDYVYFGDDDGRLWAIEKETGEPVWFHKAKGCTGYLNAEPVIDGNRLYITSYSLDPKRPPALYCYEREAGQR